MHLYTPSYTYCSWRPWVFPRFISILNYIAVHINDIKKKHNLKLRPVPEDRVHSYPDPILIGQNEQGIVYHLVT